MKAKDICQTQCVWKLLVPGKGTLLRKSLTQLRCLILHWHVKFYVHLSLFALAVNFSTYFILPATKSFQTHCVATSFPSVLHVKTTLSKSTFGHLLWVMTLWLQVGSEHVSCTVLQYVQMLKSWDIVSAWWCCVLVYIWWIEGMKLLRANKQGHFCVWQDKKNKECKQLCVRIQT